MTGGTGGSPRPLRARPPVAPTEPAESSGTGVVGWVIVVSAALLACAGQVLWLYDGTLRMIGVALVMVAGAILLAFFMRLALRGLPKRRSDVRRPMSEVDRRRSDVRGPTSDVGDKRR